MAQTVIDRLVAILELDAKQFSTGLRTAGKDLQQAGQRMQQAGLQITAATLPMTLAITGSIKAFTEWETAVTGIAKTVDAPVAVIDELADSLVVLSEKIPVSANELARLGKVGGQLGVEVENLREFAETAAGLGEATDLGAEEAALGLARLSAVMGTSQKDFVRLGSTLVELGNNFKANEPEILALAQRLTGAAAAVGATEAQVLGLATALREVGVEAQAGGSAFSRVLLDMQKATKLGSKEVVTFAKVAGVSVSRFTEIFEKDAVKALELFVEGIGRMLKEGKNVPKILEDIGFQNIRVRDALLRTAGAQGLIARTTMAASEEWEEANALAEETARAYATVANRFELTRNKASNVAAELGEALLPAINAVLEAADNFLDTAREWVRAFTELDEGTQKVITVIVALVAGIGPLIVILGTLAQAIGFVVGGLGLLAAHPVVAAIVAVTAVIGLGVAAWASYRGGVDDAKDSTDDAKKVMETLKNATLPQLVTEVNKTTDAFKKTVDQLSILELQSERLNIRQQLATIDIALPGNAQLLSAMTGRLEQIHKEIQALLKEAGPVVVDVDVRRAALEAAGTPEDEIKRLLGLGEDDPGGGGAGGASAALTEAQAEMEKAFRGIMIDAQAAGAEFNVFAARADAVRGTMDALTEAGEDSGPVWDAMLADFLALTAAGQKFDATLAGGEAIRQLEAAARDVDLEPLEQQIAQLTRELLVLRDEGLSEEMFNVFRDRGIAALTELSEKTKAIADEITLNISGAVSGAIKEIGVGVLRGTRESLDLMEVFKDGAIGIFSDMWGQIIENKLKEFDPKIEGNLGGLLGSIKDFSGDALNSMVDFFKQAGAAAIKMVVAIAKAVAQSKAVTSSISFLGGLGGLVSFAEGGFVAKPTLAVVGDAPGGEFVTPARDMQAITAGGGGGLSVVVMDQSQKTQTKAVKERGPDGRAMLRLIVSDIMNDEITGGGNMGTMLGDLGVKQQPRFR